MCLEYICTNESLNAITAGLDLNSEDNVLAVAGSGDQAFAILEYAKSVTAVDINPLQVEFVKQRVEYLKYSKFKEFFDEEDFGEFGNGFTRLKSARDNYFRHPTRRLKKIKAKLSNLSVILGDIWEIQEDLHFSKIYLSNVRLIPKSIVQKLKDGGLIYASLYPWDKEPPNDVKIDEELTSKANRLEKFSGSSIWQPLVYRKVLNH